MSSLGPRRGGFAPNEVEMIGQGHDVAGPERVADAPGRGGEDERLDAEKLKHADREHRDAIQLVPLVMMETPLQDGHAEPPPASPTTRLP